MNEVIVNALTELDDDLLYAEVQKAVDAGVAPMEVIEALQQGMVKVGERFAKQEYYLSELILSAEMFNEAEKILGVTASGGDAKYGNFVMGTVEGDIHDIGKNIVASVMRSNGFNVIDIGVDAKPQVFMDAIKEYDPKVVGMSCLLTTAFPALKETVEAIEEAGLRDGRLLLIGGGPVDGSTLAYCGADRMCPTAQDTVRYAQDFAGGK